MLLRHYGLSECYYIHFKLSLKEYVLGFYGLYPFVILGCVVLISGLYNIIGVTCEKVLVTTLATPRLVWL